MFTKYLDCIRLGLMFFFLVSQDNIKTAKQEQAYYKRNSPYQQGDYQPPQAVGSKIQQNSAWAYVEYTNCKVGA